MSDNVHYSVFYKQENLEAVLMIKCIGITQSIFVNFLMYYIQNKMVILKTLQ